MVISVEKIAKMTDQFWTSSHGPSSRLCSLFHLVSHLNRVRRDRNDDVREDDAPVLDESWGASGFRAVLRGSLVSFSLLIAGIFARALFTIRGVPLHPHGVELHLLHFQR